METKDYGYYEEFFNKLVPNHNYRRLGKAFKSREKYFFYDTGTGKVFECEQEVYEILRKLEETNSFAQIKDLNLGQDKILESLERIRLAVETENILKAPLLETFTCLQVTNLENVLKNEIGQITFEVTQKCNLRCDYCIYQDENPKFRDFSSHEDMSFETAKKVIDYVKDKMKKEFYITFYGGEPLLNFSLIKQCIEYVKELKCESKIMYSLTTNLTLMTKEIAEYLASVPDFAVVCSIDGDKDIHDEHRKDMEGNGSFERAMEGLKHLRDAYGDRDEHIIINMVLTRPLTDERFNKIQQFIENCPYLNENNTIMYSYADDGKKYEPEEIRMREQISDNIEFMERYAPVSNWSLKQFESTDEPNKIFTWGAALSSLLKIHKRKLSQTPMKKYYFNGCCIPGGRRLYITVDGKFHVCERVGESPAIGDANLGIDIPQIQKKYIDEYMEKSIPFCQNCWAAHLCGICYATCYDGNGLDMETKKVKCINERFNIENSLILYHELLEKNPVLLETLNEMD